ncbi:DNA-directed RNA polymerase subunit beta' [Suicoccus acidiformans]|uniref:DNA-directed RNA polymerase subunit beta' n=1 Tax=Suicoccus acidiformans TaxID=2036206 RepID=A0A347WNI1_9LACT|nr:DNA-directed RNA polymerase subunit beta' [Suicoccus acidiformans]AXY26638.1 DNA-directed RNA polymerase subunit beta' [Suicoccus acidiformans]
MIDVNTFDSMKISLASPEKIRSWSYGEVKKPETINYRTLKPEKDGLFDERIFGPTKDWECACGKYKRIRYKGRVCERCGVEVTRSNVRRERMGHIELAAPVTHVWYFKGIPSRMGLVLDLSPRLLEEVIYFASYIVTDPGDTMLEYKSLLSETEYRERKREYGNRFTAKMGAEAIRDLLRDVDVEAEVKMLKEELRTATGQKRTRAVRRLEILDSFLKSGNQLTSMIMEALPVIPPELRPMVQLEGGRFATSDLNDLYRRVINRNNRLKRLLDLGAPNIIVQNEKRMLQEAVDSLIDNGRRGRAVTGPGNRPLKSLSHMLKGKQGRFRQNLLGKRVDYSGRSVIVVGPNLKMYQCGLPKEMAIELFKPFVMKELVEREIAGNVKMAKKMIERLDDAVWSVVEDVIKEHPVLLNRAPTLHRLGIQAFEPVLVEGKAIRLHPLVCEAYNADFDGDQMAVHVPLSEEAQAEARMLMLAAQHILNPKDGKPVVTPSQDMVLGNYYLTLEEAGQKGEGMLISSANEAVLAYENGYAHLHTRVAVPAKSLADEGKPFTSWQEERLMVTTIGKLIFNEIMPKEFPYLNEPTMDNLTNRTPDKYFLEPGTDVKEAIEAMELVDPFKKKNLGNIIAEVFKRYKVTETSNMLDRMKDLGYHYSTQAGITVGVADVIRLESKHQILEEAHEHVEKITKQYRRGLITEDERYNSVIRTWEKAKDDIQDDLVEELPRLNSINMMSDSGARGNISNFTQLAGMRGNMAAPSGKIIELPITSNFREGLSVLEMFISTHGARKGMTDTALKTADSGYLTRRLVDVAQDVIVREDDCGTDKGVEIEAIRDGNSITESLAERMIGRYTMKTIYHPETGEVIIGANQLITEDIANQVTAAGIESVSIRSVFTCNTNHGVCKHCYGQNLATGEEVEVGEAVGTIAAQSIGEPGTQLTMRTFHTGGVAGGGDITQGLPRIQEIFEARNPKGQATITEVAGVIESIEEKASDRTKDITVRGITDTRTYNIPFQARLKVTEGDQVERGQALTEGSIDPKELLRVTDVLTVEKYLLNEVQGVYRGQGVEIGDKHVEVMIRQMLRKVRVMDPAGTDILPGAMMDISDFTRANEETIRAGETPATARPVLLGITKAALETNSFISAASFQETTRVLTDAAIRGDQDHLIGLKENVVIGKLIPAGTGMQRYRDIQTNTAHERELQAIALQEAQEQADESEVDEATVLNEN